jgi:hypothetical protein
VTIIDLAALGRFKPLLVFAAANTRDHYSTATFLSHVDAASLDHTANEFPLVAFSF